MIIDLNKGLESVAYNHLNLSSALFGSGETINYIYDANGQKLAKKGLSVLI